MKLKNTGRKVAASAAALMLGIGTLGAGAMMANAADTVVKSGSVTCAAYQTGPIQAIGVQTVGPTMRVDSGPTIKFGTVRKVAANAPSTYRSAKWRAESPKLIPNESLAHCYGQ